MSRHFATTQTLQAAAAAIGNGEALNVAGLARLGLDVSIADAAAAERKARLILVLRSSVWPPA